ncbi:vesicle-fusing ATPase-like, partial [Phalaenopsis equestris]|uniref:vesicle-fusing ATPase-like n=1 Tax=Phalaenopsis equestris TaxID=78828 RepID=UPI0009E62BB9
IVVNTPSQEFALTNFAFCSAGDFRKFATPGSGSALVLVGDSLVLSLIKHGNIPDGQIALNSIQRRHTKVSAGDQISVITFFPPSCFSLALLTLELDNVKAKANRNEELDAVVLAQHLRKKFVNQVLFSLVAMFGRPLKLDAPTYKLTRPSLARVMIKIDVTLPPPDEVWIGLEHIGYWQKMFGHDQEHCFKFNPDLRKREGRIQQQGPDGAAARIDVPDSAPSDPPLKGASVSVSMPHITTPITLSNIDTNQGLIVFNGIAPSETNTQVFNGLTLFIIPISSPPLNSMAAGNQDGVSVQDSVILARDEGTGLADDLTSEQVMVSELIAPVDPPSENTISAIDEKLDDPAEQPTYSNPPQLHEALGEEEIFHIVNGPEVLSKYVGETEKNVRDLFADAEQDQKARGDQSDLHVIIFDEIDAICKTRGSTRDGTGVHDGIVNQLLTKIDGVNSLNNVLLIGMTNRKDLLDEALLRPGRLEVLVEINLPDENGRLQILQIHTSTMKENSFLAVDVNLQEL